MTKIKILFVITRFAPIGGAQIHIRDICNSINSNSNDKYECAIFTNCKEDVLKDQFNPDVKIYAFHAKNSSLLFSSIQFGKALYATIKVFKPNIVSLHSTLAGLIGRVVTVLTNTSCVIYTAHGWSLCRHPNFLIKYLAIFVEKSLARLTVKIITVSNKDLDFAHKNNICTPNKLVCIQNGMKDIELKYRKNYERKFILPLKIVVVARFENQKDHLTIINALKTIDKRYWTCTFIGEGRLASHYKTYIQKLNLTENFVFKGALNTVYKELTSHDIFLLCSFYEGLPRSILEAMSVGLPIIATNVGGVSECVQDEVNGKLLDIQAEEQLSNCVRMILKHPSILPQWGARSRIIYENKFTFSSMLEKYKCQYEQIFNTHSQI